MEAVELTPEIKTVLEEYARLQQTERALRERKQVLQEKLKVHMRGEAWRQWCPELRGERLKVIYRCVPKIDYDEDILRDRLGERYASILEPDLRKIKNALPVIGEELMPLIERIGSPSPEKIKSALRDKAVTPDEFKGAFTKKVKEYITVAHAQPSRNGGE